MKSNNKGFSIVELIVVIAIMAVLVALLAPQFLRYVDKSRMSIDIQNVELMCHTVETYAADVDSHHVDIPSYNKIVLTNSKTMVDSSSVDEDTKYWYMALENAGIDEIHLRSDSWFADGKTSITLEAYRLGGMPYFKEVDVKEGLSILEGDSVE